MDETRSEIAQDILELLRTDGWRMTVMPALKQKCAQIERRLAKEKVINLEEVRFLQGQHSAFLQVLALKEFVRQELSKRTTEEE